MLVLVIRRRDGGEDEGLVGRRPRASVREFRFEDSLFVWTSLTRHCQLYRRGRLEDPGGDIPGEIIKTFGSLIVESVIVGSGLGNHGPIAIERERVGIKWAAVRPTDTLYQVGHTTERRQEEMSDSYRWKRHEGDARGFLELIIDDRQDPSFTNTRG